MADDLSCNFNKFCKIAYVFFCVSLNTLRCSIKQNSQNAHRISIGTFQRVFENDWKFCVKQTFVRKFVNFACTINPMYAVCLH